MYILLFILVRIAAFILALFVVSKAVVFLTDKKIVKTRHEGENKLGYFLVVLSTLLLYFAFAEVFTIPIDMYISK